MQTSEDKKTILVINYQITGENAPKWDIFPSDLWLMLIGNFFSRFTNEVGLCCRIEALSTFHDISLEYRGERDKYSVYILTESLIKKLSSIPFNIWNASNEAFPSDYMMFWHNGQPKAEACFYESYIEFINLAFNEYQALVQIDPRIKKNLREDYPMRMS